MSDLTEGLTRYLRDEFGKDFTVSGVVGVSAGASDEMYSWMPRSGARPSNWWRRSCPQRCSRYR
ncbi:Putative aminoglycoside phosphotransferase [Mycobacteroides abscessus]|nr:Putative aminoglycoside phosphotransferase [Mycobacteroides abscessus]